MTKMDRKSGDGKRDKRVTDSWTEEQKDRRKDRKKEIRFWKPNLRLRLHTTKY